MGVLNRARAAIAEGVSSFTKLSNVLQPPHRFSRNDLVVKASNPELRSVTQDDLFRSSIAVLPNTSIAAILSFLHWQERLHAREVCAGFKEIVDAINSDVSVIDEFAALKDSRYIFFAEHVLNAKFSLRPI